MNPNIFNQPENIFSYAQPRPLNLFAQKTKKGVFFWTMEEIGGEVGVPLDAVFLSDTQELKQFMRGELTPEMQGCVIKASPDEAGPKRKRNRSEREETPPPPPSPRSVDQLLGLDEPPP